MKISENGINMIKKFEGCRLIPYKDRGGKLTVGYGHLTSSNSPITQERADEYLRSDICRFERLVNDLDYNMNKYQFDALVSFAFNIGGVLQLTDGNKRSLESLPNYMVKYCHVNGHYVRDLAKRREIEAAVFRCLSENDLREVFLRNNFKYVVSDENVSEQSSLIMAGLDYVTLVGLAVRESPWGSKKNSEEWTDNGREHDVNPKNNYLDSGTIVTCLEVRTIDDSVWIRIPSGWICAVESNKVYVK